MCLVCVGAGGIEGDRKRGRQRGRRSYNHEIKQRYPGSGLARTLDYSYHHTAKQRDCIPHFPTESQAV